MEGYVDFIPAGCDVCQVVGYVGFIIVFGTVYSPSVFKYSVPALSSLFRRSSQFPPVLFSPPALHGGTL